MKPTSSHGPTTYDSVVTGAITAQTERLVIRSPVEEDRSRFVELFTDEAFTVFSAGVHDDRSANIRFDGMLSLAGAVPYAKQPVVERETGTIVGYTGVGTVDLGGLHRLEWGWRFVPEARGRGYATEATTALLAVADGCDDGEILCLIAAENRPSRRVADKTGFRWWRRIAWEGDPGDPTDLLVRRIGAGGPPLLDPAQRTTRRPVRSNTALVREALGRLAESGAAWSPRFVGAHHDQEVVTWLPGRPIEVWWDRPDLLDDLTRAVRRLHDTTSDVSADQECLIHDDVQPRNVVVHGDRVGLIDWEQLRPGRRVEDVAQLCWAFADPGLDRDAADPRSVGRRWRRVLDAYGSTEPPIDRGEIVPVALAKIERCIDEIVRQAADGSARHGRLRDRGDHLDLARLHRWITTNRQALTAAIT